MRTAECGGQRLYFLDNLRAFIVLLVIMFHVAMGYTTWKLEWWVNDSQQNALFDLFVLATDVYIMPVMFLIAGYFAPPALQRHGSVAFLRGKLRRITLPWVAGVLLFAPLIAYSAVLNGTVAPPTYLSFWANQFFGAYYQQAHYWFLGVMTGFFLLFTVLQAPKPSRAIAPENTEGPSATFFSLFALLTASLFFLMNLFFTSDAWVNVKYIFMIQPVRIGVYFCYFGLGAYAWQRAWFTRRGYRPSLPLWGIMAVISLLVFLGYRVKFTLAPVLSLPVKAGHATVFAVFCLTATMALVAFFQRYGDSRARLWRKLAANSYGIYFVHQWAIIPLAYGVKNFELNIGVKYAGVSLASILLSFWLAAYVIGPLGLRPYRRNITQNEEGKL